jgi:hypothetical protein
VVVLHTTDQVIGKHLVVTSHKRKALGTCRITYGFAIDGDTKIFVAVQNCI